jgi:hypothetical protein
VEKNQRQTIKILRFVDCLGSVVINDSVDSFDNESIAVLNSQQNSSPNHFLSSYLPQNKFTG